MDPQESASASDAAASARHSLNRPMAMPGPERPGAEHPPGAWFTVVLRGYDRAQVDARLNELDRRIRDEVMRAEKAEAALGAARSHVRRLQEDVPADGEKRGFGVRLERVLQAAEREAADLRERAATEATELLEKARADAERQHRRTEQALLGRAATLDQEFTARSTALDAREREVDERIGTAQREADAIRGQADRAAAEERSGAERRAADLLRQAENAAQEQRSAAARDVARLSGLRDQVRAELSRLQGLLGGELEQEPVTVPLDDDLFGPIAQSPAVPHPLHQHPTAQHPTAQNPAVQNPAVQHPAADDPGEDDATDGGADDVRTGTLRIARDDEVDDNPNERTSIGTIPPFTASSIGVLPFRERSGASSSKIRPFAFGPEVGGESGDEDDPSGHGPPDARTSDDGSGRPRGTSASQTRSTYVSRGPR